MSEQSMSDGAGAEVSYSFGQRLSSARRALNLTHEQVAMELHLSVNLIKALEEEDYTQLPAQMYIIGYLRNYARLLKIPAESLLEALDKAELESPVLIKDVVKQGKKASHSKLAVKLFVLVLVFVVVAGIVSWVQTQDFSAMLAGPVVNKDIEPIEATEIVEEVTVVPAEVVHQDDRALVVNTAVVTEPEKSIADVVDVAVVAETKVDEIKIEPKEVAVKGISLSLSFSDDCWVEVKDSQSKVLAYDLYRGGQNKNVTGTPPFSVFLGNARAVEIEYNGLAYDASSHIDGKLARFTLGKKEDYKSDEE